MIAHLQKKITGNKKNRKTTIDYTVEKMSFIGLHYITLHSYQYISFLILLPHGWLWKFFLCRMNKYMNGFRVLYEHKYFRNYIYIAFALAHKEEESTNTKA